MISAHVRFRFGLVMLALWYALAVAASADGAQPKRKNKAGKKSAAAVTALQDELRAVRAELQKATKEVEQLRKDVAALQRPVVRYYTTPPTGVPQAGPSSGGPTQPRISIRVVPNSGTTPTPSTSPPSSKASSPSPIEARELSGHTLPVTAAAISPDGRTGVTASWDGSLRIWDLDQVRERAVVKASNGHLDCLVFAPDGKQCYVGGADGVFVVDVAGAAVARKFPDARGSIYAMALTADGKTLVTAGGGDVHYFDTTTGKRTKQVDVQVNTVRAVHLAADGRLFCVGGYSHSGGTPVTYFVRMWNVETGHTTFRIDHPTRTVFRGGVLAAGDKRAFIIGPGGDLKEYDLTTGNEIRLLDRDVYQVAVSGDGKVLAAAAYNGFVTLHDVATGAVLHTLPMPRTPPESIAISTDGRRVIVGGHDRKAYYFALDPARPPGAAWSPYASAGTVAKTTAGDSVRPVQRLTGHTDLVHAIAVSPDGKRAVSAGYDRSLRVWDLESGRQLSSHQASGMSWIVNDIAFLPDGKHVLLACGLALRNQRLRLWNLETSEEVRLFEGHERTVNCVAVSPDGKTAVSGSDDDTARLWDIASGKQLHVFVGHTNSVDDVAFSPDGSTLATCSNDGTVRIWDLPTRRELRKKHFGVSQSLAFVPSRPQLLVGGSSLELLDYENVATLRTFAGHERTIGNVDISPDGKRFLSAGLDKRACVHDAEQGKLLLTVPAGQSARYWPAAFALGGRRFITVAADNVLEVWDVP